ncbi:hypothetical protein ACLB2K_020761 [Fragaria x ananassa]
MPPFFFQKYWDLVGVEVSNAVISFLSTKNMPHDLNYTNVVLIPEVKEVQHMTELRPIALCNVVYKIASKVLANKLKTFLADVISLEQSAFVPDRLISDNTLVAAELAYYMHKLRRGKEGFMALKLDISKAYDRLERLVGPYFLIRLIKDIGEVFSCVGDADSVTAYDKYLGIPTRVGQSKNNTFAYIKDNLSKKLTGLRSKLMSAAGSSSTMRPILVGRDRCEERGLLARGDGQRTNIWYDPWLKGEELLQFRSPGYNKVSDLLLSPGVWNVEVLQEFFPAVIFSKILALPISSRAHQDRY